METPLLLALSTPPPPTLVGVRGVGVWLALRFVQLRIITGESCRSGSDDEMDVLPAMVLLNLTAHVVAVGVGVVVCGPLL